MPLGMDPNPQISLILQIVDAQATAKNFLQQSIIKAWMQPSLRRYYRFLPLSRVAEDFCVHPFQLNLGHFIGDSFRQDST
jgi:hypothetical protein